jgi:hypothetical protein
VCSPDHPGTLAGRVGVPGEQSGQPGDEPVPLDRTDVRRALALLGDAGAVVEVVGGAGRPRARVRSSGFAGDHTPIGMDVLQALLARGYLARTGRGVDVYRLTESGRAALADT